MPATALLSTLPPLVVTRRQQSQGHVSETEAMFSISNISDPASGSWGLSRLNGVVGIYVHSPKPNAGRYFVETVNPSDLGIAHCINVMPDDVNEQLQQRRWQSTMPYGVFQIGAMPIDHLEHDQDRFADRYNVPQTSVSDRIDELILEESGQEDLLLDRQQQASWLKLTMVLHWGGNLPQPFIGFDLDEGLFIASWQSDNECNTLTIDAKSHKGWYDPWPSDERDNPLPGEINLDTEEAWELLRIALTTTR